MRYDGINNKNKRTSINISKEFIDISSVILRLYYSQKDINELLRQILKNGLKNGLNNKEVREEVFSLVKKTLAENELLTFEEINNIKTNGEA